MELVMTAGNLAAIGGRIAVFPQGTPDDAKTARGYGGHIN
jgi:hypothetical protein